jgi:hypothetical protein
VGPGASPSILPRRPGSLARLVYYASVTDVADHLILQRERTDGASGILWTGGIIGVMAIVAVLFAGLGAALVRLSASVRAAPARRPLEVA